jgi:hypothetical protein
VLHERIKSNFDQLPEFQFVDHKSSLTTATLCPRHGGQNVLAVRMNFGNYRKNCGYFRMSLAFWCFCSVIHRAIAFIQ